MQLPLPPVMRVPTSHPSLPCPPRFSVLGCLKDALFELHEGVAWGLLSSEFERQQRQQVSLAGNQQPQPPCLLQYMPCPACAAAPS